MVHVVLVSIKAQELTNWRNQTGFHFIEIRVYSFMTKTEKGKSACGRLTMGDT